MTDRRGVLLVNLGSPEEPTPTAVRAFLDEFLGDPYVVDLPRRRWWLIRKLVVLPLRGRSSARLYRTIWDEDGSPLITWSRRQAEALEAALADGTPVRTGMRYGAPTIADGLDELVEAGCRDVLAVPLFPQRSRSSYDTAVAALRRAAEPLDLEVDLCPPLFDEPAYVQACGALLADTIAAGPTDHVVLSFHGIPRRFEEQYDDPYREHCERSAHQIAEAAGLAAHDWTLVYQSRFGREPWLEPEAAKLVPQLATRYPNLVLASPGFAADCLETLEELDVRLREDFLAAGGQDLRRVPALNDDPRWIAGLATLVRS